jgi:hypothetical protein
VVSRCTERGDGHGRERKGEAAARPGSGGAVDGMDLACGAYVLVVGKREWGLAEDTTHNGKCIPRSVPRALWPTRLGEGVTAYSKRASGCGGLGRTPEKIQLRV